MRSIIRKRTGLFWAAIIAFSVMGHDLLAQQTAPRSVQPARRPSRNVIESGRTMPGNVQPVASSYEVSPRSRIMPTGYVPKHMKAAQGEVISAQGAMPVEQGSAPTVIGGPSCVGCAGGCESCIGNSYFDDGVAMGCGDCGEIGCSTCSIGCGGCPPELIGDCWINSLGGILYRAEYFGGAQGFNSPAYQIPGRNDLTKDCAFGFNAGVNTGIPLCRLTCGLLSGQVGVRTVNSDFSGSPFTSDNRDQLFATTGLYRRVDSGIQFGVVADWLFDNSYTDSTTVQIRGDLGWVFLGGNTLGFRFAENVQDDVSDGIYDGTRFTGLVTSTFDWYRFYYRQNCAWGGYTDAFLGWSDDRHVVGGVEYDVPMGECWALQSSFVYFMPENDTELTPSGGNANEAWNIAVGLVYRPQGRAWYRSYDRPILPVADNGTMVLRRRF